MYTLNFNKRSWVKENEYEYYLDIKLPSERTSEIENLKDCNIIITQSKELCYCDEIKIICNDWLRIVNDKPLVGTITILPREYNKNENKVNRISQIKNEIFEFDKVVEDLYKRGSINLTAYYTMKGFEVALNNIIKGGNEI